MATKTIKNPDGTYTTYDDASYTPPVAAPSPISVGSLSSTETPATIPSQPETPDYLSSITSIPGMEGTTPPSPTETKQNDLTSRLEQAYAKLGGQGAAQQSAEQAAGLPGLNTQLTDINNQIQTLQKEAAMIPIALQQDAVGRGRTAAGLAPIQADQLRANAIKSLSLSAIAQTLQGNIALAQQQASKAVEAEFGGVQAEIDFLSKALQLNTQALSREDEKKAQNLSIRLQERQRILDMAKENRNIIIGWAAEASKNGASSYLINQALATQDPGQALGILAQYFVDPNAKAQALAELEQQRAQTAAIYANIDNTKADTVYKQAQTNAVNDPASKPPTQAQQTQANYATRLEQANAVIDRLTPTLMNYSVSSFLIGQALPNFVKNADLQAYDQAKRNFVNAVLRQESGAVIAESEFDNADRQYFPQPGDSDAVVQQKAANRSLVIRNFIQASGNAYQPLPEVNVGPAQQIMYEGKRYNVDAQGNMTPA